MKIHKILSLSLIPTLYVLLALLFELTGNVLAEQEPLFEIPVQLIGFPVIALSVRLSQFARKLMYSLNPGTYKSRTRRDTTSSAIIAEKQIINEFGLKACILEEPCTLHAARSGPRGAQPNWPDILSYKVQSTGMKQWYLLSVFIGDVIRDVPLCKHLAKRLDCKGSQQKKQKQQPLLKRIQQHQFTNRD